MCPIRDRRTIGEKSRQELGTRLTRGPSGPRSGTDGIRAKRPLRTEYFAFDGLSVEVRDAADLVLVRPDGRARHFDLRGLSDDERFALHDRITQAREARARLRSDEQASQQIERKGRTIADWKRDLAQLVNSANDYRTSSLSIDDLVQIVSDPSTRAERRIGAAVALRAKEDEAAITRVRVAADACVSEPVKRALKKAADDMLDEVDVRAAIESDARRD